MIRHIKDLLCCNGFRNIWNDQSMTNEKVFFATFEQRMKDEFIQKCFTDIRDSDRCRLYIEVKTVFGCESYMNYNIRLRISSHKFLVERARWLKVKVPYTQRTCTLCNSNDIEDEYHVTLVCEYLRDVRKKYIRPFYYQRPNMMKFLDYNPLSALSSVLVK